MNKILDVIVIGLGAHGSSALYHLSKNNISVCGIDRFAPPHSFGSSHGQSRIIRQAYHESPMYVPLVKEAYNLWHELENVSGKKLLLKTGGIMLGDKNASVVTGAKLSAEMHDLEYEYLDAKAIKQKFPALKPTDETVGVVEKDAGMLFPEKCIHANLEQANKNGAMILLNETVQSIKQQNSYIEIETNKGIYQTEKLIVSAGAWLTQLMPELKLPLTVERQVMYWFKNNNAAFQPDLLPEKLPVYIWEYQRGKMFYGFPDVGDGIKIAYHHAGEKTEPENLRNQVADKNEIENIMQIAATYLKVEPSFNYANVCMYTNTPDENFIIDFHPSSKNIMIASPCSGHGFKFASVTGKILSDMATGHQTQFDISPFSIQRFKH